MDKQIMVYLYNRILFNTEKKCASCWNDMESTLLSEKRQSAKALYYMILSI